jgi:hypothetical protein
MIAELSRLTKLAICHVLLIIQFSLQRLKAFCLSSTIIKSIIYKQHFSPKFIFYDVAGIYLREESAIDVVLVPYV